MGNRLDKVIPEDETLPTGCSYCSETVRVVSFNQVHSGDHICQGGNLFTKYLNRSQKHLYKHHAIVKNVICDDGTDQRAVITFIHYYSTPYDAELKIRETNETRDLRVDEIYIIRYRYPKFQSNQVLYRAQKCLEKDPDYFLPVLNCEHFCTWCITGEELSCQVEKVKEILKNIIDSLLGPGSKAAKLIIQFTCNTADDIATMMNTIIRKVHLSLGATALSGVAIITYFIRSIVINVLLNKKFKKGQICKNCYTFKVRSIWICFTAFSIPTIASIIIGLILTGGGSLATILVPLTIILLAIVWGGTKAYKAFRSPFIGDKTRVNIGRDLQMGDVIQYRYWKLLHEAVVLSVDIPDDGKEGNIYVLHYGLHSLTSNREIMKEKLIIDLNKMEIFKLDYSRYTVYPSEEVVRRAMQRLGEKKFGVMTNRSCHFCHWAKVNESSDIDLPFDHGNPSFDFADLPSHISADQSVNRPSSTQLIKQTWIKTKSEIQGGDPIQFRYHRHWHNGVCTKVITTGTERELTINVVHYSYQGSFEIPEVKEEIFSFDLSVDNVYIYHYHPAHKYSRKEIIDRAKMKIGEKKYSMLYRNSRHLVEEITLKAKEQVINSPYELEQGDIVSFSYWGIRHRAILVSIVKIPSDTKCCINVIHYAARSLFAKRTVVEESISIDLAGNNLRKVSFQEYLTYPGNIVVERARKRLGEEKFNASSNNSSQLVHWAKVNTQSKDIFYILRGTELSFLLDTADENQNQASIQQAAQILPVNYSSVKKKGQMYMEPIRSWEEFIPGHIVEFKYYCIWHQGILTEVDSRNEKIKIIHYGAKHLFAKRTILEDETKVNLKKESFYIYHPDAKYAYTPDEVIKIAKSRVGEQNWKSGNRSYDFCRACVLRERKESEN
ncbi:hypothetical protein ACJMK2_037582 [Sinanodonta woodiana]|uniref:LRAT domain-containing protein n=1 Tax=Sinanodonta woodiana TaxID=1069815 RepID=A0ABD3WKV8_SINWO